MGSSISYTKKLDEGFYRVLIERQWNGESVTILTFHKDKPQGIFFEDEVKEFETERSDGVSELWVCDVETGNTHYKRITVKMEGLE